MRKTLIFFAWSGLVSAIADAGIAVYAVWEVATSAEIEISLTVDEHLKLHLRFLYWLKEVAYFVAPNAMVDWLFGLPALLYFPFRIVLNLVFGWWMLWWARRLKPLSANNPTS